jgi:hypothetical protein
VEHWSRVEALAAKSSKERYLAALDRAPDIEPAPEDRV